MAPKFKPTEHKTAGGPPTIVNVDIGRLQLHPRQEELGGPRMEPAKFARFVEDIRENGVRDPLILMADGVTVICGRNRREGAREAGLKQVPCIVRADLSEQEDPALIKLLIGDNLHRRHLSKLQQAKCAMQLTEIELDERKKTNERQRGRLIEEAVARQLGGDCKDARESKGRIKNAQRYIAVAQTSQSIQDAFERGFLRLVDAAAVALLESTKRDKLGKAIDGLLDGPDALSAKNQIRETVRKAIGTKPRIKRPNPGACLDPLFKLKKLLEEQADIVDESRNQVVDYFTSDDTARSAQCRRQIISEVYAATKELLDRLGQIKSKVESTTALVA